MGAKLNTLTICGQKFEIYVNDSGSFYTDSDGDYIEEPTLLKLKHTLAGRLQGTKVAIPCARLHTWGFDDGKFQYGFITGISKTGRVLAEFNGHREQLVGGYANVLIGFSKEDEKEYTRLAAEAEKARKARDEFIVSKRAELKDIDKAIKSGKYNVK